jgi:hypothetical protein
MREHRHAIPPKLLAHTFPGERKVSTDREEEILQNRYLGYLVFLRHRLGNGRSVGIVDTSVNNKNIKM